MTYYYYYVVLDIFVFQQQQHWACLTETLHIFRLLSYTVDNYMYVLPHRPTGWARKTALQTDDRYSVKSIRNRFSKFLHWNILEWICRIPPHLAHVAILHCPVCSFSAHSAYVQLRTLEMQLCRILADLKLFCFVIRTNELLIDFQLFMLWYTACYLSSAKSAENWSTGPAVALSHARPHLLTFTRFSSTHYYITTTTPV